MIGAWQGQGRKVKWFSPFLLAAWDPETEEYQSVCRCMSGFTDAFYADVSLPVFNFESLQFLLCALSVLNLSRQVYIPMHLAP